METNFTLQKIFLRMSLIIGLGIFTNANLSAQACACKESVQVSLDEDGQAEITAAMLLADISTCPGAQTVTVMLTKTGSPIPGSPIVDCSLVGKTVYGKVTSGANSCWTNLIIEDKILPTIDCPTDILSLTCVEMSTFVPDYDDNCSVVKLDTVAETITVNNCNNGLPANVLKRISRTYTVTDASGNVSLPCTYTFDVTVLPSFDDIVFPLNYDILAGNLEPLQCDGDFPRLPNGNPSPLDANGSKGTGIPYINDIALFNNPDLYCGLAVTYSDASPINIGCVTKILRSWQVVEWSCLNRAPFVRVQLIEIVDNEGPTISGLVDLTSSTSNHDCEGIVNFTNPVLTDNCSPLNTLQVDITVYANGGDVPTLFIKHGQPKQGALPVGTHLVVYTAYDRCYNSSSESILVEVSDNTPPVAICDELATIGLTSDGTAWVPATVFDDGSYDECTLNKLLVRRMNTVNCAPCETPSFVGFTLLGEYGTGNNKHYYYLSQHEAMPAVAFKNAKAMGGYVVSYETLAEATWAGEKAYSLLPADYNKLLIGLSDRITEGVFKWESGATTSYVMPWAVGEPDGSGDYVAQRRSLNWRDVGNDDVPAKYIVEITDPCGWSSYTQFCCSDIGVNQMVAFRAVDASGNFNDCMVSAVIQDKIGPTISCPANITVDCDFAYNPSNLRADFGWPTATDNCENPVITTDSIININSCRIGSITRNFTVTDRGGRTATCSQVITFAPSLDQIYNGPTPDQWPSDLTVDGCGDPNSPAFLPAVTGRPIITDGACSLVGDDYRDQSFSFNNPGSPACFKILRTWTVIDWCQPLIGGGYRTFTHVQEIKVIDNIAPVFAPLAPTVTADTYDNSCLAGTITLTASATDVCTNVLKSNYKIDLNNDGSFETNVNGNGNTIVATGEYPVGTHKIVYTFEDRCGNLTSREQLFTIVNRKAPSATALNGLSMNLTLTQTGEGQAEVWATDFDVKSSHPCGYAVLLSFSPVTVNGLGQLVGTPNWVFDCDDLGENEVSIWVAALTPTGDVVQTLVTTYIIIQDNNNICDQDDNGRIVINGNVLTEQQEKVQDVKVVLAGSEMHTVSNAEGHFVFDNVSTLGNYQVNPSRNDDPVNGITTLDIVMIQRHILQIEALQSPYKLIASDVNKDGKITGSDLVELRKLILGTIDEFSNNNSWRFVDKNYNFFDNTFAQGEAFPETYNIQNATTDMTTDFIAVKIGDINGSAKANNFSSPVEARTNNSIVFTTDNQSYDAGKVVTVPVKASHFSNINGMQFTIAYDPALLTFNGINSSSIELGEQNIGLAKAQNGLITLSWNENNGVSVSNDETLFTLEFAANTSGTVQEAITINSDIIRAEAYNQDLQIVNVKWNVENRTDVNTFALYQNTPNPFNATTTVSFDLSKDMPATVTVFDINGKVLVNRLVNGQKGNNSIILDANELPVGIVYYSVKAGEFIASKKMVVIK